MSKTYKEQMEQLTSEPVVERWGTSWYLNDNSRRAHRMDGPAVMWKTGDIEFHFYGIDVTGEVEAWASKNDIKLSKNMTELDTEKLIEFMETFNGKYPIVINDRNS